MTREEIVRMAADSGCGWAQNGTEPVLMGSEQITRFAALVAAAEREACAKVCEEHWRHSGNAMNCANAIRSRDKE